MAERWKWTLGEVVRAMLKEKSMPQIYWAEAIRTTVYIHNQISASRTKVSPHKLYFEQKPNLAHLRVFGSIAYVHVPIRSRRSLMPWKRSVSWLATPTSKRGTSATNPSRSKSELATMLFLTNHHLGTSHHLNPSHLSGTRKWTMEQREALQNLNYRIVRLPSG